MQYDAHVRDWFLWTLRGSQQDEHVWAWRSYQVCLRGFYANLVRYQEPLGIEIERVLHENLFNLYAR